MPEAAAVSTVLPARPRASRRGMSYKFQRLREKIRAAIATGELSGKLPGERLLARRFHVNAKTLSKALTDLAAEGILDRSIGRGTFVKGTAPATSDRGRWLILIDVPGDHPGLIKELGLINPEIETATDIGDVRPSYLNQFAAVIDVASDTSEHFLRDLVVRNMPVIAVNHEPRTYSMHAVLLDLPVGAARLGRHLALAGHRRLAVVEPRGQTVVTLAVRQAMGRVAADSVVDSCDAADVLTMVESGVTAIVCNSCAMVSQVKSRLDAAGIAVPARVSLAALGCMDDAAPCSGVFCSNRQIAEAVDGLLRDATTARPTTLWLAGECNVGSTIGLVSTPFTQASFSPDSIAALA